MIRIRGIGAVVHRVRYAVTVWIGLADAHTITIDCIAYSHGITIITGIEYAKDNRIIKWSTIQSVIKSIIVIITVADITITVTIEVCLIRISHSRAIIHRVRDAIAILIGRLTDTVATRIQLIIVSHGVAIITCTPGSSYHIIHRIAVVDVIDTIAINVRVAGISLPITVHILLVWVVVSRAVVTLIRDVIAITIRIITCTWALVTCVTDTIIVRILLIRIGHDQTVVAGVTDAIIIKISLVGVRGIRTIVCIIINTIIITICCLSYTYTVAINSIINSVGVTIVAGVSRTKVSVGIIGITICIIGFSITISIAVTDIAVTIIILILLISIGGVRTVVEHVTYTIIVAIYEVSRTAAVVT